MAVTCTESSLGHPGLLLTLEPKRPFPHPKDFNGDGILDRKDLEKLVNCLTGQGEESRLSDAEMDQLIQNVSTIRRGTGCCSLLAAQSSPLASPPLQILEESDIDKDGTINLPEFQHVVSRSPDFARYGGLQRRSLSPWICPGRITDLGQSSQWHGGTRLPGMRCPMLGHAESA